MTVRVKNQERARAFACEGNLVLINIKYVKYFEFVKERVSMCSWWKMSNE